MDVLSSISNDRDILKSRNEKAFLKRGSTQNHRAHLRQVQISKNSPLLMTKWNNIPVCSLKHMLGVEYSCTNYILQECHALRRCVSHMQNTGGYVLSTQWQLVNIRQFTAAALLWLFDIWVCEMVPSQLCKNKTIGEFESCPATQRIKSHFEISVTCSAGRSVQIP